MADVLQRGPGEQPEVRVVRWCGAHDLVRAAILTSTQAIGSGRDKFSDLDIILVLRDIRPLSEHREWLSDFGDVLAAWRDTTALKHDPPRTCWVTQYVDGSKIDFTLWPIELLREMARSPGLPDQLDVGYRVLIDKDGITSALEPASHRDHIPSRPSRSEYLAVVEEFFLESTYVAKHLWRGDLMPAKFSLDEVMKQEHLRTVLEWRIEIDHDWSIKPGAYGKGLKKLLSPELYRSLEQTYVGAAIEDNWTALHDTIALFRRVAIDVADHLGYQYPHELEGRVGAYLQVVRSDAEHQR